MASPSRLATSKPSGVWGALFPIVGLPTWLAVLNRLDPMTYAVDPMRKLVFTHLDLDQDAPYGPSTPG